MKKINQIVAAVLLAILLIPGISLASDTSGSGESASDDAIVPAASTDSAQTSETAPPTEQPTQEPALNETVLLIDNGNVYAGMDKAYNNGYFPLVQNGAATIVLPLTAVVGISQNQIRVSFDLGDPLTSPFQFGNYDMTVSLQSHAVNVGAGAADAFLVAADIPLSARRIMGRYPVVITATGQTEDGAAFSQAFTLFVTITDGIDPNASPPPEPTPAPAPEEQPVPQAKIILDSFSVSPSPVVAGDEFSISATFRNTNENQSLNNVTINVTGETTDLIPQGNETGSFYFKSIAKQETVTVEMKMKAAQTAEAKAQKILFAIEYEGNKATAYTASESAVIQVVQPIRLEIDEPKIADEFNAGDTISVSINVMNLGLSTVHNVRMSLEAPGLIPDKTAFLGNIESGASKKGDLYVFVGTLDMTESGSSEEKYGKTSGKAVLAYEDEYGQEYIEEFAFSTNINPPVIMDPEETEEEEEPKNQNQWWISVIVVAGIIGAIVGTRAYLNKRREKLRLQEDEE